MKLSARYSRTNLLTSLIVLIFSGIAYYFAIRYILSSDLDKDLEVEEQEIVAYLRQYKTLPLPGNFKDQIVRYSPLQTRVKRSFSDTEYYNQKEKELEPGRMLTTFVHAGGGLVKVEIIKSRVEAEDLIRFIFLITLAITGLLLLGLSIINRFVLKQIWKPFYNLISQLQHFKLTESKELVCDPTEIEEFKVLNTVAISLTTRVRRDYGDLKTFTDSAAHEMMTPLAVINSKLDQMLQTGTYTQEQGAVLGEIYQAISRLSRLNQSLLLFSKLDNQLIDVKETISLKKCLEEKISQFQELIQNEGIKLNADLRDKVILISPFLLDILLNNLFSNAIRHNITGGVITINLNKAGISIANSGLTKELDPSYIFKRFNKSSSSEGMGLGLAIAMQICTYYGYTLEYEYKDELHHFVILF